MEAPSDPRIRSVKRVFPANRPQGVTVTRLSILDGTIAGFPDTGAIWFYDKAEGLDANDPSFFERVESALSETLNDYPHYAGQLSWATAEHVKGSDNPRHLRRPITTWGSPNDPGVELVLVEESEKLSDIVPSYEERSTSEKSFNASRIRQHDFLPSSTLAFANLAVYEGLPGVAIQLTAFKCGGFAVGVRIDHCIGDAICLLYFMHYWAERSRKLFDASYAATNYTRVKPLFDPARLDMHAHLNPLEREPDAERFRRARSLPMHRYHWWPVTNPDTPPWTVALNSPPISPEELSKVQLSPSIDPPWATWDLIAPVENLQFHFSKDEVAKMKKAAMSSLPGDMKATTEISRQDALLAHFWILINRARRLENLHEQVYMNLTLGVRNRVSPPLPDNFVGSPIMLAYATGTGAELATAKIGDAAASIRETVSRFTSDTVSDHLYDAAHEISPQRLWQAFLGSRHVIVTSWARARSYEVDFCGTGQARYVQSKMPLMDGVLQLTDVGETGDFEVSLSLAKDAIERLVSDPMLRAYDS